MMKMRLIVLCTLSFVPLVQAQNIYLHWKLDEISGTTAYDSSGNNNDGTVAGNPVWTAAGKANGAMEYDGTEDKVTCDLTDSQWPQYSVSLWVKPNATGQPTYTSVFNNNSSGNDFQLEADGTTYEYYGGSTVTMGTITTNWSHLAVVCNGTNTLLYFNGNYVATTTVVDNDFGQIGIASNRSGNKLFNGTIDDVQVYSDALSNDQVLLLYNNPGTAVVNTPQTINPLPVNDHMHIDPATSLSWDISYMNDFVPSYNVYLGTESGNLTLLYSQSSRVYQPNQPLQESTLYYWRVDIVDESTSPETVYPGPEWNFTTSGPAVKVLEWKLESAYSSGDALITDDSSGRTNHGTLKNYPVGGPDFTNGLIGNCLELKGIDDSVINSDTNYITLADSDPWSMNLYVKVNRLPKDWARIANLGDAHQRQIFAYKNGEIAFLHKGEGLLLSGEKLVPGSWHMVTVTYTESSLAIYFDGMEVASKQLPFSEGEKLDQESNLLAYAHSGNFEGYIDAFTLWNGQLQATQVQQLAGQLPLQGDCDNSGDVDMDDLNQLATDWLSDNNQTIPELVLDDLEGYSPAGTASDFTDRWYGAAGATSTVTLITTAGQSYEGDQAVKWQYDMQTTCQVGIYCFPDMVGTVNLQNYTHLHLWLYKHAGNTGEKLSCKFLNGQADGTVWDMGQSGYPGGIDALPEDTWTEWVIELDSLHSWDADTESIPYDRINNLAGLHISLYGENGGNGTIDIDRVFLTYEGDYCDGTLRPSADMDADCDVDMEDFALLVVNWLN